MDDITDYEFGIGAIDARVAVAQAHRQKTHSRRAALAEGVKEILLDEARRQGWTVPLARLLDIFATDSDLDAQGQKIWLDSSLPA